VDRLGDDPRSVSFAGREGQPEADPGLRSGRDPAMRG
jgi:hypothetical protein